MAKLDIRHRVCRWCQEAERGATYAQHCQGYGSVLGGDDGESLYSCDCPCGDEPDESALDAYAKFNVQYFLGPAPRCALCAAPVRAWGYCEAHLKTERIP